MPNETTSKHTPGPWQTHGQAPRDALPKWLKVISDGKSDFAFVALWRDESEEVQAEAEANAKLIRSSPVLLAALKSLVSAYDDMDPHDDEPDYSVLAYMIGDPDGPIKQAIDYAEGERDEPPAMR